MAVIVEGKYDKIKLSNIIDANIITTDGFGIFKDREKREYIKRLAKEKGIVVITDSDSAGAMIRSHIKGICADGDIINVYVPQLKGKEKRKSEPSREGFLGVEGISEQDIIDALKRSGISSAKCEKSPITKTDLFSLGLSGREESGFLRQELSAYLQIPSNLSSNGFLDAVNSLFTKEQFRAEVEKWQQDTGRN